MSIAIATPPPAESFVAVEEPLYEVVDGIRVELPPMSTYSNLIASRLDRKMAAVAEETGAGTVRMEDLFILDSESNLRRRPDVAFVSAERWPLDQELPEQGDWEVVPDLCVEVTSPHDLYDPLERKVQEYFEHGVKQVWVVWPPERQVSVYESPERRTILKAGDELTGGDLLPGFRMPVAALFETTPGGARS